MPLLHSTVSLEKKWKVTKMEKSSTFKEGTLHVILGDFGRTM